MPTSICLNSLNLTFQKSINSNFKNENEGKIRNYDATSTKIGYNNYTNASAFKNEESLNETINNSYVKCNDKTVPKILICTLSTIFQ